MYQARYLKKNGSVNVSDGIYETEEESIHTAEKEFKLNDGGKIVSLPVQVKSEFIKFSPSITLSVDQAEQLGFKVGSDQDFVLFYDKEVLINAEYLKHDEVKMVSYRREEEVEVSAVIHSLLQNKSKRENKVIILSSFCPDELAREITKAREDGFELAGNMVITIEQQRKESYGILSVNKYTQMMSRG